MKNWRNLTRVFGKPGILLCLKGVYGSDWIVYIEALIYTYKKYLLAWARLPSQWLPEALTTDRYRISHTINTIDTGGNTAHALPDWEGGQYRIRGASYRGCLIQGGLLLRQSIQNKTSGFTWNEWDDSIPSKSLIVPDNRALTTIILANIMAGGG
mgnify:CR=1 FL=1